MPKRLLPITTLFLILFALAALQRGDADTGSDGDAGSHQHCRDLTVDTEHPDSGYHGNTGTAADNSPGTSENTRYHTHRELGRTALWSVRGQTRLH